MKKIIILILMLCFFTLPSFTAEQYLSESQDALPASFCWCDIEGVEYTTPIKNQAPAPTCEAYALVAAVEALVQYEVGEPFGCDLSETHLYFYANGTVARGGVHLQDAANYLIEHGVPDEGCFPDPHRPYDPETAYVSVEGWENRTVKISEWGWVDQRTDSMKQALVDHGPLIICIVQRKDFLTYAGGIYQPHWWQKIQSGHVVTIVGYDDDQGCWILRNSAGTEWGEEGYARIAYTAHNPTTPFIWPFYGGSGVMYVDGVYGNFQPEVPQVYITSPRRYHTYLYGKEFPTLLPRLSWIQHGVPRIFGSIDVLVDAEPADKVEFYLDSVLQEEDTTAPYSWVYDATLASGLHTISVKAYYNGSVSLDVLDVHSMMQDNHL